MRRCPNCSDEVPENARFCLHCGERMQQPTADGEIVAIRSTVIKAGRVTLGAEVDSGECPICGRHNARTATFRCKGCNRPLICTAHQDTRLLLCTDCVKERSRQSQFVTIAPDGSGDFATLEEAVTQCVSGTTINLLAGEYRLNRSLTIPQPLSLVGAGIDLTDVICDAGDFIVRFTGTGQFAAKGITFRHEGGASANGVEVSAGILNLTLCRFTGCVGGENYEELHAGLLLGGDAQGRVSQCVMDENDVGIKVQDHVEFTLESNLCRKNVSGILYRDQAGGVARANECVENEVGISVNGGRPALEQNICRANVSGITLASDVGTVRGNLCENNTDDGIRVFSGEPILESNTCRSNGHGIWYLGANCGGLARWNDCSENKGHGIWLFMTGRPTLAANTCYHNHDSGISCNAYEAQCEIRSNDCSENGTDGISVSSLLLSLGLSANITLNTCKENGRHGLQVLGGLSQEHRPIILGNRCSGNAGGDFYPSDLQT